MQGDNDPLLLHDGEAIEIVGEAVIAIVDLVVIVIVVFSALSKSLLADYTHPRGVLDHDNCRNEVRIGQANDDHCNIVDHHTDDRHNNDHHDTDDDTREEDGET